VKTTRQKIAEASAIGQRIQDRLQAVVDPVIDAMDENAPDDENEPRMLGFLIGVRSWIAHFEAIEDRVLTMVGKSIPSLDRDRYERMRTFMDAAGIMVLEHVERLYNDAEGT